MTATRIVPHPDYPQGYAVSAAGDRLTGIGPAAVPGTSCACGRGAVAECQTCRATFCVSCWWRHSHAKEGAA